MKSRFDLQQVIRIVFKRQAAILNDASITPEEFAEMGRSHVTGSCSPTICKFCEIDRQAESIVACQALGLRVEE